MNVTIKTMDLNFGVFVGSAMSSEATAVLTAVWKGVNMDNQQIQIEIYLEDNSKTKNLLYKNR